MPEDDPTRRSQDDDTKVAFLGHNGARLAYRHTFGQSPGIVFLSGFTSDMTGSKATALEAWAMARGRAFTRFDYQGHGRSSGILAEGSIGQWTADALTVIDQVTQGPQVLVGSSMGGWIMLLVALARPQRIAGLVGIATAADFTETLIWSWMSEDQRCRMAEQGAIELPAQDGAPGRMVTLRLIEEARAHLVLHKPIGFAGPVRLLHGMRDTDVPWQVSLSVAERLVSDDVTLTLIKDGEHRLSRNSDIDRILVAVESVLACVG